MYVVSRPNRPSDPRPPAVRHTAADVSAPAGGGPVPGSHVRQAGDLADPAEQSRHQRQQHQRPAQEHARVALPTSPSAPGHAAGGAPPRAPGRATGVAAVGSEGDNRQRQGGGGGGVGHIDSGTEVAGGRVAEDVEADPNHTTFDESVVDGGDAASGGTEGGAVKPMTPAESVVADGDVVPEHVGVAPQYVTLAETVVPVGGVLNGDEEGGAPKTAPPPESVLTDGDAVTEDGGVAPRHVTHADGDVDTEDVGVASHVTHTASVLDDGDVAIGGTEGGTEGGTPKTVTPAESVVADGRVVAEDVGVGPHVNVHADGDVVIGDVGVAPQLVTLAEGVLGDGDVVTGGGEGGAPKPVTPAPLDSSARGKMTDS